MVTVCSECRSIVTLLLNSVHEVLTLLELLEPEDKRALLCVSKEVRQHFLGQASVLTVTRRKDSGAATKYLFPNLTLLIVQNHLDYSLKSQPVERRLASVTVSGHDTGAYATVFMLTPLETSRSAWVPSAVKQLAQHMARKWPDLNSFTLAEVEEPGMGTALLTELSKGKWRGLAHLNLCIYKQHHD